MALKIILQNEHNWKNTLKDVSHLHIKIKCGRCYRYVSNENLNKFNHSQYTVNFFKDLF